MNNANRYNIQFLIMIIVYKIILEYAYTNIVVQYWGYWFPMEESNRISRCISWLFILVPFSILKFDKKTFSNYVLNILYFINYIPGCIIMEFVSVDTEYKYLFYTFWGILFWFNIIIPYIKPKFNVSYRGKIFDEMVLIFLCFIVIGVWLIYANARMKLSLEDIYVARMEARSYNMPIILKYLFGFAKSLIRVGILIKLYREKWGESIVLTIVGIIVYMIEGSKGALFSVLLVWILWGVYHIINEEKMWLYLIFGLDLLGVFSIMLVKFFDVVALCSYYFQRMLFLPAIINIHYYNYFKVSEKDYFRQSIVGKITGMTSPYELELPRLIGKYAFDNIETNANTGLVGDAYANLGYIGVVAMPFLIILFLRIFDLCMKGLSSQVYVFMGIIIAIIILSNSFFTTLLSNGVIVIALYLLLMERKRTKIK